MQEAWNQELEIPVFLNQWIQVLKNTNFTFYDLKLKLIHQKYFCIYWTPSRF